MKRSRLVTAAAALGLAAGTLGLAGTASAAEAAPAAASAPAQAARASSYAIVGWISEPPSYTAYLCTKGADYQLIQLSIPSVASVANECSWRVWLHQNSNGSGYGFCVSPGANVAVPVKVYRQLQVTANGAAC
jgi:hypothetical protein